MGLESKKLCDSITRAHAVSPGPVLTMTRDLFATTNLLVPLRLRSARARAGADNGEHHELHTQHGGEELTTGSIMNFILSTEERS